MDQQTEYREPWENPDSRAPGPEGPAPRGPEIPEDKGSFLLGVVGALLGALVGAVPWFLVSTFTSFYVGWLGFLVGWAAAFGYRKLKGRRSFGLAIVVVVISSLLALIVAEYGSWMYVLCTDPEWQADAAYYGIPVARLAFDSLLMPENFEIILPGLVMGLVIGGLGIFSAGKYVRQYTDPGMAAEVEQKMAAMRNPMANFQSTGLELPRQFTVGFGSGRKALMIILAVVEALLIAFLLMIGIYLDDMETFSILLVICLIVGAAMVFAILQMRKHIDVDGDRMLVKGREFRAQDIAGVSISQFNGAIKLYSHDNKVVAQFNNTMKNAPRMMQWLKEHNIPLRG